MLTLFAQALILINQLLGVYTVAAQSMQATMVEHTGEELKIHIQTDTGRLGLIEKLVKKARGWVSSYFVNGGEAVNATTGIVVTVTGTNVASIATVDYYLEGVPQSGGTAYRFLWGNSTSVTVNGAELELSNRTTIENHLMAMDLNLSQSHTVDYYVYVRAEAVGTVSGETLTSIVTYQNFDQVTYQYGVEVTDTYDVPNSESDAFETGSELFFDHDSHLYIQSSAAVTYSSYKGAGIRFSGIQVPSGASISYACITLNPGYSDETLLVKIYGHDADNSPTFIDMNGRRVFERTRTASVTSVPDGWKDVSDNPYVYPVTSIVSEITNRTGWSPGNALSILIIPDTGGPGEYMQDSWKITSYDGNPKYAPELDISYISYQASWYPLPPLSLAALPLTLDLVALTFLLVATTMLYNYQREGM